MTKLKLRQLVSSLLEIVDDYSNLDGVDDLDELKYHLACDINTQCNLGLELPEEYTDGWEQEA